MTMGREDEARLRSVLTPVIKALERSAKASEALLEIAKQEQMAMEIGVFEPGPLVCPVCGEVNPTVFMEEMAGSGPLAEFVLELETKCCNSKVYAIPDNYDITTNREEAIAMTKQKGGKNG